MYMTNEQKQFILRKMNTHTCPNCGTPIIDANLVFSKDATILAIKPCCDKCMDYCVYLYNIYYKEILERISPLVGNPKGLLVD